VGEQEIFMKKRMLSGVLLLAMLLSLSQVFISASAADYHEKSSGSTGMISISNRVNTLYYKNPHGNFRLRIYATTEWYQAGVSKKYSVRFYDNAGRCLWSADNQGDKTYEIGGNVTKIVVTARDAVGPTIHWQRK
jgi:hypothetical protein